MKIPAPTLPKVKECIIYVESLGYKLLFRSIGSYVFEVNDRTTRPRHNWIMKWTLQEMRHAVRFGC